jgi:hypothetical protein
MSHEKGSSLDARLGQLETSLGQTLTELETVLAHLDKVGLAQGVPAVM